MKNNQPEAKKGKTLRQVMVQELKAPLWLVLVLYGGAAAGIRAVVFHEAAKTGQIENWIPSAVMAAVLLAVPFIVAASRKFLKTRREDKAYRAEVQKAWKDDKAVSPVIGVILMVAITVVLAAVVYSLVHNLANKTPDAPTNMGTSFTAADANSLTYRVATVEAGAVQWDTCAARDDGGSIHPFNVNGAAIVAGSKAQAGDVFRVSSLVTKTTYNLALVCAGSIATTVQGTTL